MRANFSIEHEFVEFIPAEPDRRTIYISIAYATAVHNCFCGCGLKVVTPISPTGWQLTFDGDTVTLTPSVGNWGFRCRSHYWIKRDRVIWAGEMSQQQIEAGRGRDRAAREAYFGASQPAPPVPIEARQKATRKWRLWDWLTRRS
jgi:hypothetical protein